MRFAFALLLAAGAIPAQNLDALLAEGILALDRGASEKAYATLSKVVEKRPKDGRALIGLAEASRRLGRIDEADAHADAVADLAGAQPHLFRGLSIFYENGDEPEEAAHYEAFYLRAFPEDFSGFERAAALYLAAGNGRSAAEFARSGLERRASAPLQDILGKALARTGDSEGAEQALLEAVRLAPYDEEFRYDLGYVYLLDERFDRAAEVFEEARRIFDKSARLALGLGVARYGQERFQDAVAAFLRASDLAPGAPQPHYYLGRTLSHAGERIGEVVVCQKRFLGLNPEQYLGPFLYAQALIASLPSAGGEETLAAAEALLQQSIERNAGFWESHFELGALLERAGRLEEAAASLETAAKLNPAAPTPHGRLAQIYTRLGRSDDAGRERTLHHRLVEAERTAPRSGLTLDPPPLE